MMAAHRVVMFAYADAKLSGDPAWGIMRQMHAFNVRMHAFNVRLVSIERERRSKGGKARAAKAQAMPAWMIEVFDRAYASTNSKGKARIGHVILLGVAWRMAGPEHPDRHQLTEHRARQYLKNRRKRPAEN
jgi:hypothetical protein